MATPTRPHRHRWRSTRAAQPSPAAGLPASRCRRRVRTPRLDLRWPASARCRATPAAVAVYVTALEPVARRIEGSRCSRPVGPSPRTGSVYAQTSLSVVRTSSSCRSGPAEDLVHRRQGHRARDGRRRRLLRALRRGLVLPGRASAEPSTPRRPRRALERAGPDRAARPSAASRRCPSPAGPRFPTNAREVAMTLSSTGDLRPPASSITWPTGTPLILGLAPQSTGERQRGRHGHLATRGRRHGLGVRLRIDLRQPAGGRLRLLPVAARHERVASSAVAVARPAGHDPRSSPSSRPEVAGASPGTLSGPVGGGFWRSFLPKVGATAISWRTRRRSTTSVRIRPRDPFRIGVYLRDRTHGAVDQEHQRR